MLNALLWNLLLTAGLTIVLAGLCRLPSLGRRPALRHWLWLLLLVKLVTPPLIAVPLLPAVAGNDEPAAMATPPGKPVAHREPTAHRESVWERRIPANPALDDTAFAAAGRDVGGAGSPELQSHARGLLLGGLLALSLLGTGLFWTVHGVHAARLYRWLRRAGTENSVLAESCAQVASSLQVRRVVRSCVVEARTTPLLWPWRRPLVVLPRQLIDDLSPQQLHSIVAHELAHLLRRDHWANLFAFLVKGLLWWNPVVWWVDRELRAAQELCCDALAIAFCNADRRGYAATLFKALDFIQTEPLAPRALAVGMGSRGSILRRFEMISETHISYRLSRGTFLVLLVLGIPLVCIPVRGQEKSPAAAAAPAASDAGAVKTAADTKGKKEAAAKPAPKKTVADADAWPIDPKVKELGEAVRKRMIAWSDAETLVVENGKTVLSKLKKNVTPVAQIRITPHFVKDETRFDAEGVDATGKTIGGTKQTSPAFHDAQPYTMNLGKAFPVDGKQIMCMIQLKAKRRDGDRVAVEVKTLFMPAATPKELEALLLLQGKRGRVIADFQTIYHWAWEYKNVTGHFPRSSKAFKKPLPKDVYSPTGEGYRYEAHQHGYIVSSCGKDGIHGNADDQIQVVGPKYISYGDRRGSGPHQELGPLVDPHSSDKDEEAVASWVAQKASGAPGETVLGVRPQGNCSIAGKVVSAASGEPIKGARIYLHYNVTHGSIFINTASDGTFALKDIAKGPFSLRSSHTAGCQDAIYNPQNKPGQYPDFSLKDGEHRSGIVLKAKPAYRISGKIVDPEGEVPENVEHLTVLAWFKRDDGKGYESEQAGVNQNDGSYAIDGLSGKPAYVMAIDWERAKQGTALPPIYYPSTFSRSDAKLITFDKTRSADDINITLRKEGGLILEGTVRDDTGKPVPEAFVVVHRRDMLFDFVTAYTDPQGHYQIQGLGDGQFLIHVDAVHRGLVRMRTPLDLDRAPNKTERNLTLTRGVSISGKFVDEKGKAWRIGTSYGSADIVKEQPKKAGKTKPEKKPEEESGGSFSLTNFRNKYRPADTLRSSGGEFSLGKGNYESGEMLFPTKSTFVIQGMTPGHTMLDFGPKKERQKVVKVLWGGQDILKSGIDTKPGQEIKDVTIVIGAQ